MSVRGHVIPWGQRTVIAKDKRSVSFRPEVVSGKPSCSRTRPAKHSCWVVAWLRAFTSSPLITVYRYVSSFVPLPLK